MHLSLQQNAEGWFITDLFEGTSRGYGQQEVPARIILEELSLDGFGILARYPDLFSIECQTKNNALRRVWQPVNEQALLETISGIRQFAKLRDLYFSQFVQTVMASPEGALIRCDYSHAVSRSTPERSVEITVAAGEDWLDRAALEALFRKHGTGKSLFRCRLICGRIRTRWWSDRLTCRAADRK